MADSASFRILVVGDVHDHWDSDSESAVRALAPDVLMFVGDYGDEAEEVVARIGKFCAEYEIGKRTMACAVLGNHEAFKHAFDPKLDTGAPMRQRALLKPFNPAESPRYFNFHSPGDVDTDIDIGPVILGGRPFSWGGPDFDRFGDVSSRFFDGLSSFEQSAQRICKDIDDIALKSKEAPVVILSHNGPSGLGSNPSDICGNDYEENPKSGDQGDPDLRTAIEYARKCGRRIPLVTFGHFHRSMKGGKGVRCMVTTDSGNTDTVYVNAAFVPRIRTVKEERQHHFMSVRLDRVRWEVQKVDAIWCNVSGQIRDETCYFDRENGGLTGAE